MNRVMLTLLCFHLSLTGCTKHYAQPSESNMATTQIAPLAVKPEFHRLNPELKMVMTLQEAFFTQEGPSRRGKCFERLVSGIEELHYHGVRLSESEILFLLGPPDYGISEMRGALFLYPYDRFGKGDWYARIDIAPSGEVKRIGWNATSEIDFKLYPRFMTLPNQLGM